MDRRLYYLHDPAQQAHLLACYTRAQQTRASILIIPPLLEEMNACRRHISQFAKQASFKGFDSLYVDLLGTGDSQGELGDVHALSRWHSNINAALAELQGPVIILAIRTGSLLLDSHIFHQYPVLFWQPVLNGKRWVKSLKRTQQLADKSVAKDSSNNSNHFMGYELATELLNDIEQIDHSPCIQPQHQLLFCQDLAPANCTYQYQALPGYAFWQHNEESGEQMQAWFDTSLSSLCSLLGAAQ